jgi:hypothetical protein
MILNMDNVAFVAALPDAANRRKKLRIAFGSTSSGGTTANIPFSEADRKL